MFSLKIKSTTKSSGFHCIRYSYRYTINKMCSHIVYHCLTFDINGNPSWSLGLGVINNPEVTLDEIKLFQWRRQTLPDSDWWVPADRTLYQWLLASRSNTSHIRVELSECYMSFQDLIVIWWRVFSCLQTDLSISLWLWCLCPQSAWKSIRISLFRNLLLRKKTTDWSGRGLVLSVW